MTKDVSTSIFIHLLIFVGIMVYSLFSYNTIIINQINVSLVSDAVLQSQSSYIPLQLNKSDITQNSEPVKSAPTPTPKASLVSQSKITNTKTLNERTPTLIKSKQPQNVDADAKSNPTPNPTATNNNKQAFLESIEKNITQDSTQAGLDKGELSNEQLKALNEQIRGCWYGQGGHNINADLSVELILTMNPDATIQNIQIPNIESYNTPLRKAVLNQVLRALHDNKCKQLELPNNSFNNWRTIHIVFNPKDSLQ